MNSRHEEKRSAPPRAALVTGAGKRLGRAMAIDLGKAGFRVAVHYNRSADDAEDAVAEINAAGGDAVALRADLADESATGALIAAASAALGPVSLLVNSASAFENDDIDTMTRESWDLHVNANLRAPAKLAQDMARQAPTGADNLIVNIVDQRVLKPTPQFLSYTVSKAALFALTKTLAQGLGPRGVRVNAIGPGPTMKNRRQTDADWRAQNEATVLGRGATPDDIVGALRYLISAPAVTGQMIAVDGGQHLSWRTPDVLVNE
ncbi:MAG: SDR family oxidoreductase [Parvularculaceae bacterium]